jgi:hypothetical protein
VQLLLHTPLCSQSKDFYLHQFDENGTSISTVCIDPSTPRLVIGGHWYGISCRYRAEILDFATRHYTLAVCLIDRYRLRELQHSLTTGTIMNQASKDEYNLFESWIIRQRQGHGSALLDIPLKRYRSTMEGTPYATVMDSWCDASWRGDGLAQVRLELSHQLYGVDAVIDVIFGYLGMGPILPSLIWHSAIAICTSSGTYDPPRSLPYTHGGLIWEQSKNGISLLLRSDATCRYTYTLSSKLHGHNSINGPHELIYEGVYSYDANEYIATMGSWQRWKGSVKQSKPVEPKQNNDHNQHQEGVTIRLITCRMIPLESSSSASSSASHYGQWVNKPGILLLRLAILDGHGINTLAIVKPMGQISTTKYNDYDTSGSDTDDDDDNKEQPQYEIMNMLALTRTSHAADGCRLFSFPSPIPDPTIVTCNDLVPWRTSPTQVTTSAIDAVATATAET